jgi:hypothetical protein
MKTVRPAGKFETTSYAIYDVGASVKAWGRRGIVWGGTAGFVLGVALVAIPFSSHVLSFGILGTLIVVTVEGAFVAGALSAFAALVYGKGVLQCESAGFDRSRSASRWATNAGEPMAWVSAPDWQMRRQIPGPAAAQFHSETTDVERAARQTLQGAALSLTTIDAWENGNTGP